MCRYKITLFLLMISLTGGCYGSEAITKKKFKAYEHLLVSISYISWKETADLNSATASDKAKSDFFGLALGVGIERYFRLRHGYEVDAQVISGQAGVGSGTGGQVNYTASGKNTFWGLNASGRYSYRLTEPITFSIGPILQDRQVHTVSSTTGSTVTNSTVHFRSGFEYGLIGGIRLRFGKGFEIQQSIGTLAANASTIWSLALGYRF